MSDAPETPGAKPDWRHTVFLPRTDFPMKAGLPQKEPAILARWKEQDLYAQVRRAREGREKFILHDGPPYANGDIHIGHTLNKVLKDMVVRSQTLLGKDAPYVPGWDCHGLPIEWKIEEQYRKKKMSKDDVPLTEFRAECRAYAAHWVDVQREQFQRLGITGNWANPYLTMDYDAEAAIVAELMKFAESGQLYRGAKPVMWSPVEKTALAEAEIEYEDVTSTQIDVAFEIEVCPGAPELVGAHAVVWTTTPWTIPVNQAIAYNSEVEYVVLFDHKARRRYVVASEPDLLAQFVGRITGAGLKSWNEFLSRSSETPELDHLFRCIYDEPQFVKGSTLVGAMAKHPMHHLGGFYAKPRPFLPGDFVTTDAGTGLVHMSPDHGEDDFALCRAHGLDPAFAVMDDGRYRDDWLWLGGADERRASVINQKFNALDGPICSDLREAGALLSAGDFQHSYPHSWRSKARVIYRCTPQWFIAMDQELSPLPLAGGEEVRSTEGEGLSSSTATPARARKGNKEAAFNRWEGEGGAVSTAGLDELDPALDTNGHEGPAPAPFGSSSVDFEPVEKRDATVENSAETDETEMAVPPSLRELAMQAIADTRFVPEKGRNRIASMVEGRPDWVISRQRAWGVPIALFVERKTGQLLVDPEVNRRIVEAIREQGVDAWSPDNAARFLGNRNPDDYEMQTDILDVWFDSGCTHVFTLEGGRWPEQSWPADLYLEGSDQHRGWFQSSLLESCGTRGRAPYKTVLTHGFTMDSKGMKMSKSLGNTINPLDLMKESGADILRLWALSVDSTEDHRIGKEILAGVSDQYRKLRNTFRYLLGALDGFSDEEKLPVEEMPELERYMLSLLAELDAKLRQATDDFDFNSYTRLISDFANNDLSAFYFDIRKDCLYCDAPSDPKRRAYRTVLDALFHALVRWCAPVLVFTAEEVWSTRYPDGGSVHLLEWPELFPGEGRGPGQREPLLGSSLRRETWDNLRALRTQVTEAIEPLRRDKVIGSSLEAEVTLPATNGSVDLAELFIVSTVHAGDALRVTKTDNSKCGRCWRHLPEVEEDGDLCNRCETVVNA